MKAINHSSLSIKGALDISKEQMAEKQEKLFDLLVRTIQEKDGDSMSHLVEKVEEAMKEDTVLNRVVIMKLIHGELAILKEMGVIEADATTLQ